MPRKVGTWPLGYEQTLFGIEHSHDINNRLLAVRSARYHMEPVAGDATRLSRNLRIFEALSSLLHRYRKHFDKSVLQGGSECALAADLVRHPVIHEIGAILRHVLAKPQPDIGCFDHPFVWCMDFLDLQQCNFPHAQLEQSSFYRATLSQANFTYANMTGMNLTDMDMSSTDCSYAIFAGAQLSGANLAWANLSYANMQGVFANHVNLSGTILDHAVLAGTFLSGANMGKTSLLDADLHAANMFAVKLHEAKLKGTILTGTGITMERIQHLNERVQWDSETQWGSETDCDGRNPLHHGYY